MSVGYIRVVGVVAFLLFGALLHVQLQVSHLHPVGAFPWASAGLLLLLAVFAEFYTVRAGPGMEVSAGFLAAFLSVAILGPLGAFMIAVVSQLVGFRTRPWEQTLCYASTSGLVTGIAALFYWGVLSGLGGFLESSVAVVALVGLGAAILYRLANFALGAPVLWLRRGIGLRRAWHDGVKPFLPFDLFFSAICLGLIAIYHLYLSTSSAVSTLYSTLLVLMCLLPVLGLIYSFRAYTHQREMTRINERLARRNERLALQAIASQITALDLKDNYTARHSASVALWARDIARYMGLSDREQNLVHLASLLHDVGKIGVPDELLKSPQRLDPENWALIESHCLNGYRILRNISQFEGLATVVLSHHEHYDGNGYPGGLVGEEIPLFSRIICVADSYSAMVSDRPYGPPLSTEVAMAELEYKKSTQFDPFVVDAFLAVLGDHDEDYRRGVEVDFHLEVDRIKYLRDLPPEMSKEEMLAMVQAGVLAPAADGPSPGNAERSPQKVDRR